MPRGHIQLFSKLWSVNNLGQTLQFGKKHAFFCLRATHEVALKEDSKA